MPTSKSWNSANYLFLITLIILGIAFRFYQFDLRPLHHDESLHGLYSVYFFQDSINGFYRYNPLLHGPLLYHSLPWTLWVFGINKFAIRLPAVVLGSLILLLPYLFRQKLSKYTILSLTAVMAFSPTMIYWSRFIRHDNFIFASLLLLIFAFMKTHGITRSILIGISVALQFSAKENTFIHVFFVATFLGYELFLSKILHSRKEPLLVSTIGFFKKYKVGLVLGLLTFIIIFTHFYSAGFIYFDGVLDGAYRKSLFYWFEQHQKERITGPFSYPFLINSLFESWWVFAIGAHLYFFYKSQSTLIKILFALSLSISTGFHLILGDPSQYDFLSNILKLKIPFDYYLFFPLIFHSVTLTSVYLAQEKRDLALTGFIFFASLFTYSYLGEKVPWLAMYPLISGLIFFSFFFDGLFQKPILALFIPLILFNVKTAIWTNFSHSYHPSNLLSQVHTTKEFEDQMHLTRATIETKDHQEYFLVKDSYTWPTTWYLHGMEGYHFSSVGKTIGSYDFILAKPEDHEVNVNLSLTHTKNLIPLRSWWLPRYEKLSFPHLLRYALWKKPWSESGKNDVALWERKSIATSTSRSLKSN